MLKWHFNVAQQPKPQKWVKIYFAKHISFWETTTPNCKGDL